MPYQLRQSSCRTVTSAQPARRRPCRPPRTAHQLIEQHSWREPLRRSPTTSSGWRRGLTLLLIWPPFRNVPVSKALDELKRLKHEIMPKVEAA